MRVEDMRAEVCLVSTWKAPCGIAGYSADLVGGLEAEGVPVRVVPIERRLTAYMSRPELAEYFRGLAQQAAGSEVIHIQHEFGFFAGSYGMQESLQNFGIFLHDLTDKCDRLVITFHSLPPTIARPKSLTGYVGSYIRKRIWKRKILKVCNRRNTKVVAPSRYLRRLLIDSGIKAENLEVIPQGAPTVDVIEDRDQIRSVLGYEPGDVVLTMFGFVSPYKGHHIALEALEKLPDHYKLAIVGGPHPESTELGYEKALEMASDAAIDDRALVTGYVPLELARQYLVAADVCLLPYVDASLVTSAAAMWALASGRPVVASKIPAFTELADVSSALTMVNPGAPRELARAVLALDNSGEAEMRAAAALEYCASVSWSRVAQRHRDAYRWPPSDDVNLAGMPVGTRDSAKVTP